jgi:flagellar biosynthetic protein FliR
VDAVISPQWASLFALALVRSSVFIMFCPPFSGGWVPRRVRFGFCGALAVFVAGTADPATAAELTTAAFIGALLTEALLGFALALTVQIALFAVAAAGDLIDVQVGFTAAGVWDPLSQATVTPFGRFHQLVAIALLFASGAHITVTRAFLTIDYGNSYEADRWLDAVTGSVTAFTIASLEIALPILATLLLIELALAFASKAAPQLNVLWLGFAIKVAAVLLLLTTTFSLLPASIDRLLLDALRRAAEALSGG